MGSNAQLGFGLLRLPKKDGKVDKKQAAAMIDRYMEGDFCYFDLHPGYLAGQAQEILRELVVEKYPRESFFVANKMPYYNIHRYRDYEIIFKRELAECSVDFFDYYMLHALTDDVYEMHEKLGGFAFLQEKKKKGKIKHIGISFHDNPELLEKILKEHAELDFVQLQINYFDWSSRAIRAEDCYKTARKYKKPIIVMEPIKGGSLANPVEVDGKVYQGRDLAAISLSFTASLPGADIILSGMSELKHVQENRKTLAEAAELFDASFYEKLRTAIHRKQKILCTACGYCLRECTKNIAIPDILSLLNASDYTGKHDTTYLGRYAIFYRAAVTDRGKASDCIDCRKCESRCPQKLKIASCMREAVRRFEGDSDNMNYYSSERNVQILIYLMKAHGIRKVIVNSGGTNVCFAYSVQQDDFFQVYSSVDERSAAYMACGLAEESGEPVALSCTGATASRNYLPGLTEAYYRKLPVLAVTSTQPEIRIGQNIPQVTDRRNPPKDTVKLSVTLPNIQNTQEERFCETAVNEALLELKHKGAGPVHINLTTTYSRDFSTRILPPARVIKRIASEDNLPELPAGKIGIFVGAHSVWNDKLTEAAEAFCVKYNAVVLCDQTSNYKGEHGVLASLILSQENKNLQFTDFDLLIHIGNISGAYLDLRPREVWRVNADGKVCNTFQKLTFVFEMEEEAFFLKYANRGVLDEAYGEKTEIKVWKEEYSRLSHQIPNLPFSNPWIAQQTASQLPEHTVLHLGILNSLRSWNFFSIPKSTAVYCNTGGFGTEGCLSALAGASLADPQKLYFGVVGDLAFFYDMNVLGNRNVGSNIRIMLINNGGGAEFKIYRNWAMTLGKETDRNIAGAGHYGNQSKTLVKTYAESLGFTYMSASSKEEYLKIMPVFINPERGDRPVLLEVFTDSEKEDEAVQCLYHLNGEKKQLLKAQPCKKPLRITNRNAKKEIVLWGTGYSFEKNLYRVESYCKVRYVCDNNAEKWGKEVVPGIMCISPDALSEMEDIFVVIMMDFLKPAFQVAGQLLDMGIDQFDLVYNWLEYADEKEDR